MRVEGRWLDRVNLDPPRLTVFVRHIYHPRAIIELPAAVGFDELVAFFLLFPSSAPPFVSAVAGGDGERESQCSKQSCRSFRERTTALPLIHE